MRTLDDIDLASKFRTNFNGVPEFRNVFNLVLLRLPEETFENLLSLTEQTLFLLQQSPYASIQRIFVTPPILKPLTIVMFSQRVTEEMGVYEKVGAIIHELCHILCRHKQFAFLTGTKGHPNMRGQPSSWRVKVKRQICA